MTENAKKDESRKDNTSRFIKTHYKCLSLQSNN